MNSDRVVIDHPGNPLHKRAGALVSIDLRLPTCEVLIDGEAEPRGFHTDQVKREPRR